MILRTLRVENGHFSCFSAIISKTGREIFLIFWYVVALNVVHLLKKIVCPGKFWFRSYRVRNTQKIAKKAEKCGKWPFFEVFGNYLKNASNDFDDFLIWCSFYIFASSEKNCMSSKHPVQKLFSPEKSKNQLKPYYFRGDFWRWSVHFHGSGNHLDRFKIVKTTTIPNFKSIWSLFNVLRPVKVKQNRSKIA